MPSHGADRHAQPAVCNSAAVVSGGTRPAGSGGEALPAGCKSRWTWKRCYSDDIDDIVVDRLIAGDRIGGTRYERIEAVRQLHARGMSAHAIGRRLHMQDRQVYRDLYDSGRIGEGQLAVIKMRAAERRRVIPDLVAAGVRRGEIARLFSLGTTTLTNDFHALGLTGTGANLTPLRSRSELLATYGHLLGKYVEAVA